MIQRKIISRNNFTYKSILYVIEKFLVSPGKVLDIGCGSGTIDFYLANQGNRVFGIDISRNAIKTCNKSSRVLKVNESCKFDVMDFPDKIPQGRFDFIIFTEVIEHLENDDLAIKKISSLLKPKGILVISTPSKNAPLYRLNLTKEFDKNVGHLRRYIIKELKDLCEKNGFDVIFVKKTEGIIRNFLFVNSIASRLIRFIKYFISDIVIFVDNLTIPLFGESNIILVARKK